MFYYSWEKIHSEAKGKASECWKIFDMLVTKKIPKNHYDPIKKYYDTDFSGISFLINPDSLIRVADRCYTKDLVMYIALASRRSLADYLAYKKTTLDELYIPVRKELYINNRLLYIEDGQLNFLYENVNTRIINNGIIV